MPPKNEAKPATTKRKKLIAEDVLEHSAILFSQKGVGGTSFQDIANAMGLTRAAIYYYFPSKDAILTAMVEETVEAAAFFGDESENAHGSFSDQIRNIVRQKVIHIINRRIRLRVLDRSEKELPKNLAERHDVAKRGVLAGYMKVISRGVTAGEFRPVDARLAAFTIIGMCNWVAWWFKDEGPASPGQIADFIADTAVRSLQRSTKVPNGNNLDCAIDQLKDTVSSLEALKAMTQSPSKSRSRNARPRRPQR